MHKMIYGLLNAVNTGSNATYLLVNSVTFNGNDLFMVNLVHFSLMIMENYQCGGWMLWTNFKYNIAAMGR